jgi:hypothetical protein
MPLAQDLRHHGKAFLAPIFFVTREENDVLAFPGTFFSVVGDAGFLRMGEEGQKKTDEEREMGGYLIINRVEGLNAWGDRAPKFLLKGRRRAGRRFPSCPSLNPRTPKRLGKD